MLFSELVASVRHSAATLGLNPTPIDLDSFVASACYDSHYEDVLARQATGSLPPLVLPPPYLDVACDAFSLSGLGVGPAFIVPNHSTDFAWNGPSTSKRVAWDAIDDDSLARILRKLSRRDTGFCVRAMATTSWPDLSNEDERKKPFTS